MTFQIQFVNNTPRLFILEGSPELPSETSSLASPTASDCFLKVMEDITLMNQNRCKSKAISEPIYNFFEPVHSEVWSIPINEDEKEMLKCFEFQEKPQEAESDRKCGIVAGTQTSPKEGSKRKQRPGKFASKSEQTSETFIIENIAKAKKNHLKRFPHLIPSKAVNQLSTFSHDEYLNDVQSFRNSTDSVFEYFKSPKMADDSDTAHFTSLTVSSTGSSPLESPGKKTVTSTACRVKYESYFHFEDRIPAQMEPLTIYEVETKDGDDQMPSDRSRKLSRFPVRCPITNCLQSTVPSDFCNHITIDHPYIDVHQRVAPNKLINMTLSYKGNPNMITCQRLFLITGKIKDIGYGAFENSLPVLLLTSKVSMSKAFGCSSADKLVAREQLFIFLVGVYQFPINYTITLWTHGRDDFEPTMIKCMSNQVQYINNPWNLKDIVKSSLSVSYLELKKLSNHGRNLLSFQILFH